MDEFMFDLQKEKHLEMLNEWQNQKEKIEQETIEQCKSRKWLAHKSKLLTASNFGKVCRRRTDTPCAKMVQSLYHPRVLNVPAVEYGRENEEIAREELSKKENIEIKKCGLFIDASIPYLGASPDSVIGEDGIVEIKCPKSAEDVTPEEAITTKKSVKAIFTDSTGSALRKTHPYFYQVQGQLDITGRKYCLFCLWTKKGIMSIRVEKDDDFWKREMEPKLTQFYLNCMLPEIIDSR
ncbi:uncharacterized protein LOC128890641 [Hylaeus anthracinus]|uniref:uncharacterized protein LOC128890641 n=1 Tax=Hylaeus anthracinus TaxID=313031 RepID=UPI0023B8CCBB|nr:uncharacterized protein LOC128890641 [Hylaeus anthracinus]